MRGGKRIYAAKRSAPARSRSVSRTRKKVGNLGNVTTKAMSVRPLGNVLPAKMQYVEAYTLNPGLAGAPVTQTFRLGSIFDPDFTGVGHQPLGHDQLSPLFERYQVWKVDYHIEFVNTDTSNPQICGYRISDDSSTPAGTTDTFEQGDTEWGLLGLAGGTDKKVFTGSVTNADIHGVSYKQYMANDDYGANFGSNPSEDVFLHVLAGGLGTDTGAVRAFVHLVYHTKIMGSKLTGGS